MFILFLKNRFLTLNWKIYLEKGVNKIMINNFYKKKKLFMKNQIF